MVGMNCAVVFLRRAEVFRLGSGCVSKTRSRFAHAAVPRLWVRNCVVGNTRSRRMPIAFPTDASGKRHYQTTVWYKMVQCWMLTEGNLGGVGHFRNINKKKWTAMPVVRESRGINVIRSSFPKIEGRRRRCQWVGQAVAGGGGGAPGDRGPREHRSRSCNRRTINFWANSKKNTKLFNKLLTMCVLSIPCVHFWALSFFFLHLSAIFFAGRDRSFWYIKQAIVMNIKYLSQAVNFFLNFRNDFSTQQTIVVV